MDERLFSPEPMGMKRDIAAKGARLRQPRRRLGSPQVLRVAERV